MTTSKSTVVKDENALPAETTSKDSELQWIQDTSTSIQGLLMDETSALMSEAFWNSILRRWKDLPSRVDAWMKAQREASVDHETDEEDHQERNTEEESAEEEEEDGDDDDEEDEDDDDEEDGDDDEETISGFPISYVSMTSCLMHVLTVSIERLVADQDDQPQLRTVLHAIWTLLESVLNDYALVVITQDYRKDHPMRDPQPTRRVWEAWDDEDEEADAFGFRCDDDEDEEEYDEYDDEEEEEEENRTLIAFLTASAKETYSSSSIWLDPDLLSLRLDANDLVTMTCEVPVDHSNEKTSSMPVYAGTYRDKPVTVKRLRDDAKTLENATAIATLVKSLKSLSHVNIVSLIGLEWDKAIDIQIVTPHTSSGDLRTFLTKTDPFSLTWSEFKCQVAMDIASGLAYLHQQNLTTGLGGLTSRNVLLDNDNRAKLDLYQLLPRDFDAARDRSPSPLRWLAPEVVMGGPSTSSADVYALGVILTELDTTKLPFEDAQTPDGKPMEEMLIASLVAKGELRLTVSLEWPEEIRALVDKCLRMDPEKRPTAEQVAYQLRALLKEL